MNIKQYPNTRRGGREQSVGSKQSSFFKKIVRPAGYVKQIYPNPIFRAYSVFRRWRHTLKLSWLQISSLFQSIDQLAFSSRYGRSHHLQHLRHQQVRRAHFLQGRHSLPVLSFIHNSLVPLSSIFFPTVATQLMRCREFVSLHK